MKVFQLLKLVQGDSPGATKNLSSGHTPNVLVERIFASFASMLQLNLLVVVPMPWTIIDQIHVNGGKKQVQGSLSAVCT
jgi:hypothetical protein